LLPVTRQRVLHWLRRVTFRLTATAVAAVVAVEASTRVRRQVLSSLHPSDVLHPFLREQLVPEMLHRSWR
jgi:hypothetical protein